MEPWLCDQLREKELQPCLPGEQGGFIPVYVNVQTEKMVWERLGRNSTSAQQTAVHAHNFCHKGAGDGK